MRRISAFQLLRTHTTLSDDGTYFFILIAVIILGSKKYAIGRERSASSAMYTLSVAVRRALAGTEMILEHSPALLRSRTSQIPAGVGCRWHSVPTKYHPWAKFGTSAAAAASANAGPARPPLTNMLERLSRTLKAIGGAGGKSRGGKHGPRQSGTGPQPGDPDPGRPGGLQPSDLLWPGLALVLMNFFSGGPGDGRPVKEITLQYFLKELLAVGEVELVEVDTMAELVKVHLYRDAEISHIPGATRNHVYQV